MKTKIFSLIKRGAICCLISLICFSCVDEDLNQPKYKPEKLRTMDYIESMLLIANPVQENKYQHNNSMIGDNYGRYMSITSGAWLENFSNFNAKDAWIDAPFTDVLTNFYPNWIDLKNLTNKDGVFYAWAKILRVASMQRLTDMYGPIPYSKMATGLSQTPYDSQEDVYRKMFVDLDSAIVEITKYTLANPGEKIDDDGLDRVYSGDMEKWVRFANSLKLRMAMRIVYADEALAKEMAESAVNDKNGVIKSNDDNATLKYEPNPIYIMWDPYGDTRACADIVSYMNGYNDPRRASYFQKSTGGDKFPQYIGLRVGIDLSALTQATAKLYSSPNFKREDPLMWMNAAEVAFLRAEGAMRGWDMKGTAQELYDEGIKLSFDQYGLKGANEYLGNSTDKPAGYNDPGKASESAQSTITIKWNEAADTEEKLERIITQKWIAMWPLGQEAWSEHRRTGYPRFFKVLDNRSSEGSLSTELAARIPFSPAERITNAENLDAAIQLLGGPDKYGTKLWWDKKTNKP